MSIDPWSPSGSGRSVRTRKPASRDRAGGGSIPKPQKRSWFDEFMSNLGSAFGQQAVNGGGQAGGMSMGGRDLRGAKSFGPKADAQRTSGRPNKPVDDMWTLGMPGGMGQRKRAENSTVLEDLYDRLTLDEAMKMIQDMGIYGGGGPDYGAIEGQLRSDAASGDAKLEAMYRQLRGSYDADAPVVQAQYQDAIAGQNAAADNALGAVTAGYDSARDAQTQQLAALGIGDAAAVLAAQGGLAAQDQGDAVSNIEQNRLANVNQSQANQASALNYNTNIGNAAGLEGNEQRAGLQQSLARAMAELQTQQSAQRDNTRAQEFEAAMGLVDRDTSEYNAWQENRNSTQQGLAELMQQQQNQESRNVRGVQKAQTDAYLQLLRQLKDPNLAAQQLQVMIDQGMVPG